MDVSFGLMRQPRWPIQRTCREKTGDSRVLGLSGKPLLKEEQIQGRLNALSRNEYGDVLL